MTSPPVKYVRQASYTDFTTAHPTDQQSGTSLDADFGAVLISLNATIDRLAQIQRSDGALANLVVTPDGLSASTLALMAGTGVPRGAWLTATAYIAKDIVSQAGLTYICVTAHTSGVFATDLAASKWLLFSSGFSPFVLDTLNGLVGVNMTPVNAFDVKAIASTNTPTISQVTNVNAGTSAIAEFVASNGTSTAEYGIWGTGVTVAAMTRQSGSFLAASGAGGLSVFTKVNQPVYVGVNNVEVARFAAGRMHIGIVSNPSVALAVQGTGTDNVFNAYNVGANYMFAVGAANLGVSVGESAVNAMVYVRKDSTTNRSINAAGTVNASGADYAEYERKALGCGDVLAGQVIGFDVNGHITDKWADVASRFGVKSTDPSYVGGDKWGTEEALGMVRPTPPVLADVKSVGAQFFVDAAVAQSVFDTDMKTHEEDVAAFAAKIEAARQTVDRIAYAGKCPCNVLGASVGDYIVPIQSGAGIAGKPVTNPIFSEYRSAVGRVVSLLPDGRCTIALMVH